MSHVVMRHYGVPDRIHSGSPRQDEYSVDFGQTVYRAHAVIAGWYLRFFGGEDQPILVAHASVENLKIEGSTVKFTVNLGIANDEPMANGQYTKKFHSNCSVLVFADLELRE